MIWQSKFQNLSSVPGLFLFGQSGNWLLQAQKWWSSANDYASIKLSPILEEEKVTFYLIFLSLPGTLLFSSPLSLPNVCSQVSTSYALRLLPLLPQSLYFKLASLLLKLFPWRSSMTRFLSVTAELGTFKHFPFLECFLSLPFWHQTLI